MLYGAHSGMEKIWKIVVETIWGIISDKADKRQRLVPDYRILNVTFRSL